MEFAFSAGAVIYTIKKSKREYLLLKDGYGHWTFPKGMMDAGEKAHDTARREILEETGLTIIDFIPGFKEKHDYIYSFEGNLVKKQVTWFLAESKSTKVTISKESQDFKWVHLEEALELIDGKNNKQLLMKAHEFLDVPRLL